MLADSRRQVSIQPVPKQLDTGVHRVPLEIRSFVTMVQHGITARRNLNKAG